MQRIEWGKEWESQRRIFGKRNVEYMKACVPLCACLPLCTCVFMCTCIYVCTCACVFMYALCIRVPCIHVCSCMPCVPACICIHHACVYASLYICLRMCMNVCMHLCVPVWEYVCIPVWVCVACMSRHRCLCASMMPLGVCAFAGHVFLLGMCAHMSWKCPSPMQGSQDPKPWDCGRENPIFEDFLSLLVDQTWSTN